MTNRTHANTLLPVELDPKEFSGLSFSEFVDKLLAKIRALKDSRYNWYDDQRYRRSRWVNGTRKTLAVLGTLAIILTGVAGILRIYQGNGAALQRFDLWALTGALVLYALMGAVSFYEKATDSTNAYFRHLGVVLAIRDLWTKLQFEFLKEVVGTKAGDTTAEAVICDRLLKLAEAFCNDLDKIASGELTEWRSRFIGSLSELEAATRKGTEDAEVQLQKAVKTYENAAAEVRVAAKAAVEETKPAYLNVEMIGDFDQVVLFVDDKEIARTHLKKFCVDRLVPGYRKIQARGMKKGSAPLEAAFILDVKPGLQPVKIELA